ncbi:MAG: serine/threonine-protein kinase [Myxococcota bacterium]
MQPRQVGKYEILGELGSGGMATVYLARASGLGGFERLVALKTIHPQWANDPSSVAMFLDEARLAASVRHPNVVQVHEVFHEEGRYFIAMDYVAGITLARVLSLARDHQRPLPLGFTIHVIAEIANGLHAAHETRDASGRLLNIIHRDVAPKNVLVGADGISRILDFGVAKARDRLNVTAVSMPKGTLAYMAPEQLEAKSLDRRVDIFALSIVLWEMLARRRLFPADVWTDRTVVVAPSTVTPVPPELDAIALRGLQADPGARYPTAREMAQALLEAERILGIRWSTLDSEEWMRDVTDSAERTEMDLREEEESTDGSGAAQPLVQTLLELSGPKTLVDAPPESISLQPILRASTSGLDGEPVVVPVQDARAPVPAAIAPDEFSTPKEEPPDLAVTHVGGGLSAKTLPLQRRPSLTRGEPGAHAPLSPDRPLLDRPGLILLVLGGVAAAAFLLGLLLFPETPRGNAPPRDLSVRSSTSARTR